MDCDLEDPAPQQLLNRNGEAFLNSEVRPLVFAGRRILAEQNGP